MRKFSLLLCLLFETVFFLSTGNLQAQEQKNVLIILAHPSSGSFNHAVQKEIQSTLEAWGHEVRVRDLYAEGFQSILSASEWMEYSSNSKEIASDVRFEQEQILWADHLIFVFPTWWWGPPAILKGYLDRILQPDFAYTVGAKGIEGLLTTKKIYLFQTTGSGKEFLAESGFEEAIKKITKDGVFGFCGAEVIHHEFMTEVQAKTFEERQLLLKGLKESLKPYFLNKN